MILIKSKEEIEIIKEGGKILASVIKHISQMVKPGVFTSDLNNKAEELMKAAGGKPSFKNYKAYSGDIPFPTALCASINEEVVHAPAIPGRALEAGDIIGLDLGMEYKGLFTDMAVTVGVGKISQAAKKLIRVTQKSLELGIKQIKPGNEINDISRAIQNYVESFGYSVIRELVGHGVGYKVHEDPKIPNYVPAYGEAEKIVLEPGMCLAIEPMVAIGGWRIKTLKDGWTAITADHSLSAHFEHTVAVTEEGNKILTI